jgi:hypothetical protein
MPGKDSNDSGVGSIGTLTSRGRLCC